MLPSLLTTILCFFVDAAIAKRAACDSKSIIKPTIYGLEITNVAAFEVRSYSKYVSSPAIPLYELPSQSQPIDFCNVTITYTHPGTDDSIDVLIWLPLENWNERYLAHGGGGFFGCVEGANAAGVSNGFASASTNTGHSHVDASAKNWALKSPGNVDLQAFYNWNFIAIGELGPIAKQVIEGFYGRKPKYSYFSGCSGGGKQGLTLAQRFPNQYDGILAGAPAIGLADRGVAMNWGHIQMLRNEYWPPPCELQAIYEAAIEACDELDGVKDGVISAPKLCKFNPHSALGRPACEGRKVSDKAVNIAQAAFTGPQWGRNWMQPLMTPTMPFSIPKLGPPGGLSGTTCDGTSNNCKSQSFDLPPEWVQYFAAKSPDLDVFSLTDAELSGYMRLSTQQFASIANNDWADLTPFGEAGGKMITWHGIADQLLPHNITANYYERVLANDPKTPEYYRYFEAPGALHCHMGGDGFRPSTVWQALVDWVEKGKAPNHLEGRWPGMDASKAPTRPLCPYPKVAQYIGGDPRKTGSFRCADDFGNNKATFDTVDHSEL